jgi:hypothetical protein
VTAADNARAMTTTAARVARIRKLMASLAWNATVRAELAAEWGLSDSTVRNLSAEASRSLRPEDPAEIAELRATLAAALEEIARGAMNDRSEVTGQRDLRAATDAIAMLARFTGTLPPEQSRVEVDQQQRVVINLSSEWAGALRGPADIKCPTCNGAGFCHPDLTPSVGEPSSPLELSQSRPMLPEYLGGKDDHEHHE